MLAQQEEQDGKRFSFMDIASLWLDDVSTTVNLDKVKKRQEEQDSMTAVTKNESGIITENVIFSRFLLSHREYSEFTSRNL